LGIAIFDLTNQHGRMKTDYTCMIVDDEQDAVDFLSGMIRENCPELNIIATANQSGDAIRKYHKFQPHLVFMDIEVDELNGFDIINEIFTEKRNPHLIFVTGYNRYAIDAFKTNALGYLLKPVSREDLIRAVGRFKELMELEVQHDQLWNFIRDYSGKVRFNTTTGFILLHPEEILWCEADHNYTTIHISAGKPVLISLNLAAVEEKLPSGFTRISRSILINTRYLVSVHRRNKTCTLRWQGGEKELEASADLIRKM
jgi:two-component system LytT family response regulator